MPLLLALYTTSGALLAQGDVNPENLAEGRKLAETCMGCHGVPGSRNSYPTYSVPKLGGQGEAYIASAIKAYRDGNRSHPTMIAQAATLTDEQIQDIALYFANFTASN